MNELTELAAGRWSGFHGLAECPLTLADAELGPPLDDALLGGMFGGEPAQLRRYPATAAAPRGITCWVLGDVVVGIELHEPAIDRATLEALGPPDLTLDSGAGPSWVQAVWADRGLVAHHRDGVVRVAFGLAPIEPEAWPDDPLSGWHVERIRR